MRKVRGIRVPYFTSVRRRIRFVKQRVKSSIVKVQGCARYAKFLLILFQVFCWLMGCIILGVLAFWLRHTPALTSILLLKFDRVPMTSLYCVYALISLGVLLMVVGFAGFYASFSDNLCLLRALFATVLVLFVALLATGSPGFMRREDLAKEMNQYYDRAMKAKGTEKCDPEQVEGSISPSAAACVTEVFHLKLCQAYAEEMTPRGERYDKWHKECMGMIDDDGFVEERVRVLFRAKVKVVAWWSVVLGVVLLFEMVYIVLLMFDLRHTSMAAPDITENPEALLHI